MTQNKQTSKWSTIKTEFSTIKWLYEEKQDI